MLIVRGVLMGTGVIAVLVGSQLPWGEFDTSIGPQPVVFFLDLSQIGTLVAVLAAALGMLGLAGTTSVRSVGALTALLGLAIAGGAYAMMVLIDGEEVNLGVGFESLDPSAVNVGLAGVVVAIGGVLIAAAGLTVAFTTMPTKPPSPTSVRVGDTPAGWYDIGNGAVAYWTGSRWTDKR